MVEEADKNDDKIEFDSTGQALGYISLDQARVLALQHARDNREFYGRYANHELVYDEFVRRHLLQSSYEIRDVEWDGAICHRLHDGGPETDIGKPFGRQHTDF